MRHSCPIYLLLVSAAWMVSLPAQAQPVTAYSIASAVQTPSAENQARMFQAIDAGDVKTVHSHINFVQSFMAVNPVQGGVNLEFADAAGNTPLIRAAMQPNWNMVQYLVTQGANINAVNARGETALIAAYNAGYFDTAKLLLAKGASDPYNVAQLIPVEEARRQQLQAQEVVAKHDSKILQNTALVAGGAAVVAGGIALGSDGDDGPAASGGSAASAGSLTIDCGAGAGIHPEACTAASFATTEAGQTGLLQMNADNAYARGYDGRIFNRDVDGDLVDDVPDGHVLVAVLDTGVDLDHPDLVDNLRTDLAVTCTTSQGCVAGGSDIGGTGILGHGTNVAGVLAAQRNDVGMHGVAPEAHIIPISVIGVNQGSTTLATKYANDNAAQILNNSWGSYYLSDPSESTIPIITVTGGPVVSGHATGEYTALTPAQLRSHLTTVEGGTTLLAQYQDAVTAHRIIVFSNGNSNLSQPSFEAALPYYFQGATAPASETQNNYDIVNPDHYDWSRNWVAAAAVDENNAIASYSDECGAAMEWCLSAPGNILSTTQNGGGYNATQGTSFAAPNISGAIAVMLGAFPQLDPEDALDIIFDTATDLGAVGTDVVYGRGLVDLDKAVDPTIGSWTLAAMGGSSSFYNSGFSLSAPFGNVLSGGGSSMIFLDGYGKDYTIPLSVLSGNLASFKTSYDSYQRFGADRSERTVSLADNTTLAFSGGRAEAFDPTRNQRPFSSFSLMNTASFGADTASSALHYHTNLAEAMAEDTPSRFTAERSYENPYLRLAGLSTAVVGGFGDRQLSSRVAAYSGRAETQDEQYHYRFDQERTVSGVLLETDYKPASNAMLRLSNGMLVEDNSMLGSETSGAFGIAKSTTYHSGISSRVAFGNLSLFGQFHLGMTQVEAASSSLFTGFDRLMTSSFALGAEMSGVGSEQDRLGLVLSQPMRVMSGAANLSLPVDVLSGGGILYSQGRMNLAPSGRELDIESYYHLSLDEKSELGVSGLLRFDPQNDNDAGTAAALLAKYKYKIGI